MTSDMDQPIAILFVCLGNICRSPAAEAVFSKIVGSDGSVGQFLVDSAGTSGYHNGEPADSRMIKHGMNRGYALTSVSRKLSEEDFEKFDYIITMDNQNYEKVLNLAGSRLLKGSISRMCDYLDKYDEDEIPDPYFGGSQGFEYVYDLLEDACYGLYSKIKNERI